MSTAVSIIWDPLDQGIWREAWDEFATARGLVLNGTRYHGGQVEAEYHSTHRVTFSTFHMGAAMPDVARLALELQAQYGGAMSADRELSRLILSRYQAGTDVHAALRDDSWAAVRDVLSRLAGAKRTTTEEQETTL